MNEVAEASSRARTTGDHGRDQRRDQRRDRLAVLVVVLLLVAWLAGERLGVSAADRPAAQAWATVFVSITLQALPFLVLGVALSAAITVLLPMERLLRLLPHRPAVAVPVAGAAGMVLPGCECASVPVAGSLIARGMPTAPALTFLLAAPAINPIVLVATSVAFPGRPEMVLARFVASLVAAVAVGWLWLRISRLRPDGFEELLRARQHRSGRSPAHQHGRGAFVDAMHHDLMHAGGFLILGGALAATVNVAVPKDWLLTLQDHAVLDVLVLAALAVAVAICSEADAFVAASFTQSSPTAMLAFMVVGPMVDVKLISMQAGTFGRAFTARFAPATFGVAVVSSVLFGWCLL